MCPANLNHDRAHTITRSCAGHKSTESVVKPMEALVQQCIGEPMQQTVEGTCALVACTVAVEAVNRFVYEKVHGEGTFPYRAAPPCNLVEACRTDEIWKPGEGARASEVLTKIQEMGGVPAMPRTPAQRSRRLLPMRSWREHRCWDDDSAAAGAGAGGRRLSPAERVAYLLYNNGPCIGSLWASPSYWSVDADGDGRKVYTSGCGGRSNDEARSKIAERHPGETAWHAVVCFGYRHGGKHVLVLDNQTPTGPRRWIHVNEFRTFYSLTVVLV